MFKIYLYALNHSICVCVTDYFILKYFDDHKY